MLTKVLSREYESEHESQYVNLHNKRNILKYANGHAGPLIADRGSIVAQKLSTPLLLNGLQEFCFKSLFE